MREYSVLKYRLTTVTRLSIVLVAVVCASFIPLKAQDNRENTAPIPIVDASKVRNEVDSVSAEETELDVAYLFKSCPLSPLDILAPEMRENLLTQRSGCDKPTVVNKLYSLSTLDSLSSDYLKIQLTDASSITMNIVPFKGKTPVIVVIYTISGENRAADSDISFYTPFWTELDKKKLWYQPKVTDFLVRGDLSKSDYKELEALIPFPTYELTASEDGLTVTGRFTVGKFLSEEANARLKGHIAAERVWLWDGKKYKLEKK